MSCRLHLMESETDLTTNRLHLFSIYSDRQKIRSGDVGLMVVMFRGKIIGDSSIRSMLWPYLITLLAINKHKFIANYTGRVSIKLTEIGNGIRTKMMVTLVTMHAAFGTRQTASNSHLFVHLDFICEISCRNNKTPKTEMLCVAPNGSQMLSSLGSI